MSQSPFNQLVPLTGGTVTTIDVPQYFERVIATNETSQDVYVSTNGLAVAATEGNFGAVVLPGAWRMVGNDQPRQPLVSPAAPGSTVQSPLNGTEAGANHTVVSLLGTGTGSIGFVGLEFV